MRLALHILGKDLRLLRWQILIVQALLLTLGYLDYSRNFEIPTAAESLLNLLVSLAWSILIASAAYQEPLADVRAFWLTRPYPKAVLAAAKVLFALFTVHVPLFLVQSAVLLGHGFSILDGMATLVRIQLLVLAAITLSSFALAAVTWGLAHFVPLALTLSFLMTWVSGGFPTRFTPWATPDHWPAQSALIVISAASVAIVIFQLRKREVSWARLIGVGGVVVSLCAFQFTPRRGVYERLHVDRTEAPISNAFAVAGQSQTRAIVYEAAGQAVVNYWIPLQPSEAAALDTGRGGSVAVTLQTADGNEINSEPMTEQRAKNYRFRANLFRPESQWMMQLSVHRDLATSLQSGMTRVEGKLTTYSRQMSSPVVRLATSSDSVQLPAAIACRSRLIPPENREAYVRVDCESARSATPFVALRLFSEASGRETRIGTAKAATGQPYPTADWLSPITRSAGVVHLISNDSGSAADRWRFPANLIGQAKLEYRVPIDVTERQLHFDLGRLELGKYRR